MKIIDKQGQDLKVGKAKSALQLKRNANLRKALSEIKKDPASKGKEVQIEWKMESGKDRGVKLGDDIVFRQTSDDVCGDFVPQLHHLKW